MIARHASGLHEHGLAEAAALSIGVHSEHAEVAGFTLAFDMAMGELPVARSQQHVTAFTRQVLPTTDSETGPPRLVSSLWAT